jgi:hypothetical protein
MLVGLHLGNYLIPSLVQLTLPIFHCLLQFVDGIDVFPVNSLELISLLL